MGYTVVTLNNGVCFSKAEGKYLWRAVVGNRVLEGVSFSRSEANREATNTKRLMESEEES